MRTFIREKKIFCGPEFLEVDLFPYAKTQAESVKEVRSKKETISQPKQMNLNDKNARRYFVQLGNTNFGEGDLHLTLTYSKANLPPTPQEAERQAENMIKRIKYARKKKGLEPLKYMMVTSYRMAKDGETTVRIHHHIIMNGGLDRDEVEGLWRKRRKAGEKQEEKIGFANADRLQPEGSGIAALCSYLAKQPGGRKRWSSSQNLEKPEVIREGPDQPPPGTVQSRFSASKNLDNPQSRTNDHNYTRRELERIAKDPPGPEYWERRYPGYTLIRDEYAFQAVHYEHTGWAVYVKLRRI